MSGCFLLRDFVVFAFFVVFVFDDFRATLLGTSKSLRLSLWSAAKKFLIVFFESPLGLLSSNNRFVFARSISGTFCVLFVPLAFASLVTEEVSLIFDSIGCDDDVESSAKGFSSSIVGCIALLVLGLMLSVGDGRLKNFDICELGTLLLEDLLCNGTGNKREVRVFSNAFLPHLLE